MNSDLLFDIDSLHKKFGATTTIDDTNGEVTQCTIPLEIPGVKEVSVFATFKGRNKKGFMTENRFQSSAKLGSERRSRIWEQLERALLPYVIPNDQPEGKYVDANHFAVRISSTELTPIYKQTVRDLMGTHEYLGYQYKDYLVERYQFGTDFVDEHGTLYRHIRTISKREHQMNYLLVHRYSEGFNSLTQVSPGELEKWEVYDERASTTPPLWERGQVLKNVRTDRLLLVTEVDSKEQIFRALSETDSNPKWYSVTDEFESTDEIFEVDDNTVYYSIKRNTLIRGVKKRKSFIVGEALSGEPFNQTVFGDTATQTLFSIYDLVDVPFDYEYEMKTGYEDALVKEPYGSKLIEEMLDKVALWSEYSDETDKRFWVSVIVHKEQDIAKEALRMFQQCLKEKQSIERNRAEYFISLLQG